MKDYIQCDSIYDIPDKAKLLREISGCQRMELGRGVDYKAQSKEIWGKENPIYAWVKTHRTINQKEWIYSM